MGGKVVDDRAIEKAVERTLAVIREHPAERIAVVAYTSDEDFQRVSPEEYQVLQSAEKHQAILKAVQARVAAEFGKEVILVPFDLEDYTHWLASRQLENNQVHRGAWAAWRAGLVN